MAVYRRVLAIALLVCGAIRSAWAIGAFPSWGREVEFLDAADVFSLKPVTQMQVVRPDVTDNDALDQALLKHWGVMGPPTLILVGPDGMERRDLRVVGEIGARAFLDRLDTAGAP